MPGIKRPQARINGAALAVAATRSLGAEIRRSRTRRRLSQASLAEAAGISRGRLADLEAGKNAAGTPAEVWLALAQALGRYLRFEFARDPMQELADAGHLDMQELVLRESEGAWRGGFELATKPMDPSRSIDVPLIDEVGRRLIVTECWNTFGNLNAAVRSSDKKVAEAAPLMPGKSGDEYQVGLVWVLRDTKTNRALIQKYEYIFAARFPGSSSGWLKALTVPGATMPTEPGLVWSDVRATRLFARRRR